MTSAEGRSESAAPAPEENAVPPDSPESILQRVLTSISHTYGPDAFHPDVVSVAREKIRDFGRTTDVAEAVSHYVVSILQMRENANLRIRLSRMTEALEHFALNEESMAIAPDGTILDVNDQYLELSGYAREDLVGMPSRIMNSGVHSKEFWNEFWKTLLAGKPWEGYICNRKKNGEPFWLHTVVKPVFDKSGKLRHYLVVRQSVTEEEAIRRRYSDLALQRLHPLTRLPTRALLDSFLESPGEKAFVAIHVERLIEINNAYGYEAGNAMLVHVAEILRTVAVSEGGSAYKLDGADFCLAFGRAIDGQALERIRAKLYDSEGAYL